MSGGLDYNVADSSGLGGFEHQTIQRILQSVAAGKPGFGAAGDQGEQGPHSVIQGAFLFQKEQELGVAFDPAIHSLPEGCLQVLNQTQSVVKSATEVVHDGDIAKAGNDSPIQCHLGVSGVFDRIQMEDGYIGIEF